MSAITHEMMRKRAIQWLTNSKQCGVVLSEIVTTACEIPDAIGWQGFVSTSIECKTSRSDFFAQKNKAHVRSERGVGQYRYILCPPGVIQKSDLEADYGLLWWSGGNVCVQKGANWRESCQNDEIAMLVSALRRVRAREFLVIVPESLPTGKEK